MTSSRQRILDAYEDVLGADGERHATVEAVAAKAGVSKGGVLYHFPSKDLLAEALYDRVLALAAEDVDQMRAAPDGPARYYIRMSRYAGTPLDRALVAVARLRQGGDTRAREILEDLSGTWLRVLHESLGDLDVARAVKLIGDGLYYTALHSALDDRTDSDDDEAGLLAVIDRIVGVDSR